MGQTFIDPIRTGNQVQAKHLPLTLHEVSVHVELALGLLRYRLTEVPPQSNSPTVAVLRGEVSTVTERAVVSH